MPTKGSAELEIPNHPLLGKVVYNPEYTLVIKGKEGSFDIELKRDISGNQSNLSLMTLGARLDVFGFPEKDLQVVKVFPPQTAFKVLKVFNSASAKFAVLENDGKKYFSPLITAFSGAEDEIVWQINKCDANCMLWRNVFAKCSVVNKCIVSYGHEIMRDDKNQAMYGNNIKNIRPPYPKAWVNNTLAGFFEYAKSHPNVDLIFDKAHANTCGNVTLMQLADIFLRYENLNIGKNVN